MKWVLALALIGIILALLRGRPGIAQSANGGIPEKPRSPQAAAGIDLAPFWREMQSRWGAIGPEDLRPPFDPDADLLDLCSRLDDEMEGMRQFHDRISESYGRLEADLRQVLRRAGYDPKKLDTIPDDQNPFVNRDWELITFFPNRLTSCRIALAQIRLKSLELLSQTPQWNDQLAGELENAKAETREALEAVIVVD